MSFSTNSESDSELARIIEWVDFYELHRPLRACYNYWKVDVFFYLERIMQKINIPGRLMKDVRSFAQKNGVERIILFGSRARGTHFERSDVDLAVEGGDFDGFLSDIQENAHSLLSFDVVKYDDRITEELREEIEKDGVVIYEKV